MNNSRLYTLVFLVVYLEQLMQIIRLESNKLSEEGSFLVDCLLHYFAALFMSIALFYSRQRCLTFKVSSVFFLNQLKLHRCSIL